MTFLNPAFGVEPAYCVFAGTGDDFAKYIAKTSSGEYLITGETTSGSLGGSDVLLVRVDDNLFLISKKYLGSSSDDYGTSLAITNDGGTIIAGHSSFNSNGQLDVMVILLDSSDGLIWKKNYGGTGNDYGYTVKCLSNGNFVVSASKSVGTYNSWLLLLDSGGTEIFSTILSSYNSFCFAVDVLSDNSFITAGKTYGSGSGYYGFLTKVDSSGTKSWEKNFGNSGYTDIFYSVLVGASSNYLACGIYGNGNKLYILMTSTSGTSIWEKQIGSSTSTCYELKNLPDTNYIAVGSGYSSTTSSTDGWVIKFSYESTMSSKTLG